MKDENRLFSYFPVGQKGEGGRGFEMEEIGEMSVRNIVQIAASSSHCACLSSGGEVFVV